jgi:hypothetical protein
MTAWARRRRARYLPRPPQDEDPGNRDRRELARQQMRAFDAQAPQVREAFANSRFGVPLDVVATVHRRGPNDAVKARLRERGLFPCDVETEGVIVETIAALDDAEAQAIRRQLH